MSDHDWTTDPDIVVRTQMAISVFLNQAGDLVIRQEGQYHPCEDVWVIIAPENVPRVLAGIKGAMGVTVASGVTKDATSAARQRRHRDRNRDNRDGATPISGPAAVTERDNVTANRDDLPLLAAAE